MTQPASGDVWRAEAPHVLAALLRRSGDVASCEDAVQDAMLAAAQQWPGTGVPQNPRGWLIRVASRRMIDRRRAEAARERRELAASASDVGVDEPASETDIDDTLQMLILCAHPSLTPASQVALTLRAVAGLTTRQIAAAFLVPEATMAQRISRSKATIDREGRDLFRPTREQLPARIHAVRHALYLAFSEGSTASSGRHLVDVDLAREAIRLAESLHQSLPNDTETAGLLALMLLTDARTPARIDAAGDLVPLVGQDRSRWVRSDIERGIALVEAALPTGPVGPFQLQAAIAAVHAEATTADETDWPQIVELYDLLERIAPSPVVALNRAAALGMAEGPGAGLEALAQVPEQRGLEHRRLSIHAHLSELAGDPASAAESFRLAATASRSIPEQRYLNRKARAAGHRTWPEDEAPLQR